MKTNTTTATTQQTTVNNTTTANQIKVYKFVGQNLEDLQVLSNSVVVGKHRINSKGENVFDFVAVSGLKKTDNVSIIQTLLCGIVAEKRAETQFNNDFSTMQLNGKTEKTGICAKRFITRYLNTNIIFRADSNGKIVKAIKTNDFALKDTALKVTDKHLLATCNRNDLRAVIHHQAKAVVAQFRYLDTINEMLSELAKENKDNTATANKGKKATTATATLTTEPTTATA